MNNEIEYKCLECKCLVEKNDNFCYSCGRLTAHGYKYVNNQEVINKIENGTITKKNNQLKLLISSLSIFIIAFTCFIIIRGTNIIRPLAYIKKQINSYTNGYNSTILKTNNVYNNIDINNYDEAINYIKKDFGKQDYLCSNNIDVKRLEYNLEENYNIAKVNFCDINYEESLKIAEVIEKIYKLFPNVSGALTNITITNAPSKEEYIAYFQPMFQFINPNENINEYNKVNKTQIFLNSYYFLNTDFMSKNIESVIGSNWYVKDATWESTIAHELGHYISFKTFLKENNIDNITYVTKNNKDKITKLLQEFDSGKYSIGVVTTALNNYNIKNDASLNIDNFTNLISSYAGTKDKSGNLIADETIAEAIHDYFLHSSNCSKASLEIINIIKAKLR